MLRWFFTLQIFCLGVLMPSLASTYNKPFNPRNTYELRSEKALEMSSYMNTSSNACKDFYEYSNGNYGKYFEEQVTNNSQWSPMYQLKHLMLQKIIKHLNETNSEDFDVDKMVKQFYKSCVNKPKFNMAYADKLKAFISEFGQMPVLEGYNWQERDFNWAQVVAQIQAKAGYGIIMQAKMTIDPYNNSINRASLVQPMFMYPQKTYYKDAKFANERTAKQLHIQKILQNFLQVNENLARKTAEEILNFEIALAHGMQDLQTDSANVLYNWTSIEKLQAKYFHIWDTVKYFATALNLFPTRVMIQSIYLNNLAKIIHRTPKKQLANYIFFIYINEYIKTLMLPCHLVVRMNFANYLENTIFQKYVKEQDKEYINFMWQELKLSFKDTLKTSPLLTAVTRQAALEKLQAMQLKIDSYDRIDFRHKYATLYIRDHDFLANIRAIYRLRGQEGRAHVYEPAKFEDITPDQLLYRGEENTLHFPVAYLQRSTIWSPAYPHAINFGSIGILMAHEISNAFDDIGRFYDKNGNYWDWWDNTTARNFEAAKICMAEQYKTKNVSMTKFEQSTEIMSDIVGAKHAFKAYMKIYNTAYPNMKDTELLPVLEFSNEQLFFLAFGQAMGTVYSKDFVYDNDLHIPKEIRVKFTAANMKEFGRAFICRRGSAMNPIEKCDMN